MRNLLLTLQDFTKVKSGSSTLSTTRVAAPTSNKNLVPTTVEFVVPDIKTSFRQGSYNYSNPDVKKANVQILKDIYAKYGTIIDKWSNVFKLGGRGVIASFIATESGGKEKPVKVGNTWVETNRFTATGLMQITPIATYDTIGQWEKEVKYPMPAEMVAEVQKKAPFLLQKTLPTFQASYNRILVLLQKDVSFNIMAGCACLRWLSQRFSNNGVALFNKVMIAYNASAYHKSISLSGNRPDTRVIDSTTLSKDVRVPEQSRAYLLKMLGVDGFMDLIYKQKLV